MKQILLFLLAWGFIACNKEEKKVEPEQTLPAEIKKQITVKINGADFECTNCANTYKSGNLSGVNFREGTTNRFIFNITGFLKPGTYEIKTGTNLSFTYEKDGYYYRGLGSLILTESDTSANGSLKKFIGTFNCKTDTSSNGKTFEFLNGAININYN